MISIGIDPGTHTGLAVWDGKRIIAMTTLPIHQAMKFIADYNKDYHGMLEVVFEDARQRTWFGKDKNTNAKLQGAGSIKRDCSIWDDFLTDMGIPFQAIPPIKGGTKLSPGYLKMISGWKGRTSNHARDAAILVIGR